VKQKLATTETEFAAKTDALAAADRALTDKQAELARITAELNDRTQTAEGRQVELVTVRTQVEELRSRLGLAEQDFTSTQHKLELQRGESVSATRDLAEARARVESLNHRVTDLDQQLAIQVHEAELLGNRVDQLETQLLEQTKLLAERDFENAQLRQAHEATEQMARNLRVEIAANAGGKSSPLVEQLRAEKAGAEEELRLAREERSKLQRDLNTIHQQAESAWATERMENALLRERINDIAAEVAKMAMALEGPNSPIEAILAADPAASQPRPANDAGFAPNSTLADRIRALQSHASRARQPG
jgi:chromosome segregation ATPase